MEPHGARASLHLAFILALVPGPRCLQNILETQSLQNHVQTAVPDSCTDGVASLGYYNGSLSMTESGFECLKWSEFPDFLQQYPRRGLGDHNYCRNPDSSSMPWCFYRRETGVIGWSHCDCNQGPSQSPEGASGEPSIMSPPPPPPTTGAIRKKDPPSLSAVTTPTQHGAKTTDVQQAHKGKPPQKRPKDKPPPPAPKLKPPEEG